MVLSVFIWSFPCFLINVPLVWILLTNIANNGWANCDSEFRQRDSGMRVLCVTLSCMDMAAVWLIGLTLLPPVLVVALIPGAGGRVGMAWAAFGLAVLPVLVLLAGVARVEWRRFRFRCACLGGHPVVVPESESAPAAARVQVLGRL